MVNLTQNIILFLSVFLSLRYPYPSGICILPRLESLQHLDFSNIHYLSRTINPLSSLKSCAQVNSVSPDAITVEPISLQEHHALTSHGTSCRYMTIVARKAFGKPRDIDHHLEALSLTRVDFCFCFSFVFFFQALYPTTKTCEPHPPFALSPSFPVTIPLSPNPPFISRQKRGK